jgi:hypothetical protein
VKPNIDSANGVQCISPGCSSPLTSIGGRQVVPFVFIAAISSFSPSIILLLQLSGGSSIPAIVHTDHKALPEYSGLVQAAQRGCGTGSLNLVYGCIAILAKPAGAYGRKNFT